MTSLLLTLIISITAQAKNPPCQIKVQEKGAMILILASDISNYFEAKPKSCPLPKKGEDPKKFCQSQNHGTVVELFNGTTIEADSSFKTVEQQIIACNK